MNRLHQFHSAGFALLFLCSGLFGCNTVRGAGKDIEKSGEAIQKASDEVRK